MDYQIKKESSIDRVFTRSKALSLLKTLPLFKGLFNEEFNVLLDICQVHRCEALQKKRIE